VLKRIVQCAGFFVVFTLLVDQTASCSLVSRATGAGLLSIRSECFSQAAVSPALSAAAFHPAGFNPRAQIAVAKRGRIDSARVQELILPTKNRRVAAKVLRKHLAWAVNPKNLSAYVKRHGLLTRWPKWPIDSKQVEQLIRTARNPKTAITILKANLNWTPTPRSLKRFLKAHGLTYPWPQRPIDPRRLEELIQTARSRDEAVEILREEWGWYTTRQNLTLFIWRHRLKTPWSHKKATGHVRVDFLVSPPTSQVAAATANSASLSLVPSDRLT
jgi:hypothetical protein